MSKRQFVLLEHRNLQTEHIPLQEAKERVAQGELMWLTEYQTAAPILKAATESFRTASNKLRAPKKCKQWIWKDHFGFSQLRRLQA